MKRNEVRHIMSERNVLLKNLEHPFLVGLKFSFQTFDNLYFVLDYINGGDVSLKDAYTLVLRFYLIVLEEYLSFSCITTYKEKHVSLKLGQDSMQQK